MKLGTLKVTIIFKIALQLQSFFKEQDRTWTNSSKASIELSESGNYTDNIEKMGFYHESSQSKENLKENYLRSPD